LFCQALSLLETSEGSPETENWPGCEVKQGNCSQLINFSCLFMSIVFFPSVIILTVLRRTPAGQECGGRSYSIARVPHAATPALPTMTQNPISDSCSIFKDGRLKPGIYKIQNLYAQNFLDIEEHSRQVCCRPAKDLGEGRGLVSRYPLSIAHIFYNQKWEIKSLGDGYTVKMVSVPIQFDGL